MNSIVDNIINTGFLNKIILGDCLQILKTMPSESIQMCCTSPPYWGLRDYKIESQIWGGKTECEHEWGNNLTAKQSGWAKGGNLTGGNKDFQVGDKNLGQFCSLCGAWRGSLGLEPSMELFIQHLTEIFREVKRVLRSDGVLLINLGDSYASGKGSCFNPGGGSESYIQEKERYPLDRGNISTLRASGLKPKDLCGIPWRVAFALQADGWWLRSDIIWAKPNPMPESVTDRPAKAHEYIFLLSKSQRYYWDAEAVKEPAKIEGQRDKPVNATQADGNTSAGDRRIDYEKNRHIVESRNCRSVWTFATKPFPEAHFATFAPELPRRCILAGTSERGACSECGAPWERIVEKTPKTDGRIKLGARHNIGYAQSRLDHRGKAPSGLIIDSQTLGWRPTCKCEGGIEPCVVLDPFMGAGTTAMVALQLGRRFIGCELSPEYCEMAERRIKPYLEQQSLELGQGAC